MERLIEEAIVDSRIVAETKSMETKSMYDGVHRYDLRDDVYKVHGDLVERGLVEYALELDIKGLTVIPPEKVAPPEFTAMVRDGLLKAYERRNGECLLDHASMTSLEGGMPTAFGRHMAYMLMEDPSFPLLALNETALAMVSYRIGRNACVSSFQALVKSKGGKDLELHTDELLVPPPYATHGGGCNVTYLLTDYTVENGALLYVPGSHKYKRLPVKGEGWDLTVPVEAPAGSMVIWDGATWHGARARQSDGLRLNMVTYYVRPHMRPLEVYLDRFDEAALAKYPPRLKSLLGGDLGWWFHEEGPNLKSRDYTMIGLSAYR